MELKQITPHIYYTECDARTDRPVLGYILGSSQSVMVDAGNSTRHIADYNHALKQAGLPEPAYCVITHWHWDHTFGMHAVKAETIAHKNTNRELSRMSAWEWTDSVLPAGHSCDSRKTVMGKGTCFGLSGGDLPLYASAVRSQR